MNSNLLSVQNVPCAADQWKSMGTEYTHSIFAIKELIENSLSASGNRKTKLIIKIVSLNSQEILFSIEDDSGGVDDVNLLLTISSDSKKKDGLYSVFGHGLKHSLAYFQKDYSSTDWLIQSRTRQLYEQNLMIEVQAPYLFPNEYNFKFNHDGIHATKSDSVNFKGEFDSPGTYIEFKTEIEKFYRLNPFRTGRSKLLIESIVQELSEMISLYYLPLLRDSKLDVVIKYGNANDELREMYVKNHDFPIKSTIGKHRPNETVKLRNGGTQKINIRYVQVDRSQKHPFIIAQRKGMVCYVNGILMEGFTWSDDIFGGIVEHPSMNSCLCLIEVKAEKEDAPELSVSKTRFVTDGTNYNQMVDHIVNICPKEELTVFRQQNNSASETVMRDRRFDLLKDILKTITYIHREGECILPNGVKAGDNMRYDIIYSQDYNNTITIEEFKKESVKPQDVAQIIQYGEIEKDRNPNKQIELILASQQITNTARDLIDFYVSRGIDIKFKTFTDLHIPGALKD